MTHAWDETDLRYVSISVGLFCVRNRSLLPYNRSLLTLTHTSASPPKNAHMASRSVASKDRRSSGRGSDGREADGLQMTTGAYMYVCVRETVCVCLYACMHACMCVCVRVCVHV